MSEIRLQVPFMGKYPITQLFGVNPSWYPRYNGHNGVDWGLPVGTPILAGAAGIVVRAGWDKPSDPKAGYGLHVRIDLGNGWGLILGHFSKVGVQVGDRVSAGQVLGLSGNTGWSTGPHLHEELRNGLKPVDPLLYRPAVESTPATPSPVSPKPKPAVVPSGPLRMSVQYAGLRIRTSCGVQSMIVGRLPAGTKVQVLDIAGQDAWVKIPETDDHPGGWVNCQIGPDRNLEPAA